MNAYQPMQLGTFEWLEIVAGGMLVILAITALVTAARKSPSVAVSKSAPPSRWAHLPETRLLMIALPLELLWEIAQFPLYTVWHQNDWGYIAYGLIHCTLGDLIILLSVYVAVALLSRNRHWYAGNIFTNGALFTLLGAAYTVFSEIMNVRFKGTWGYTDAMPIVPILGIGGMPLLQWLLIPPVILWLMRRIS